MSIKKLILMVVATLYGFLLTSCLLPGMIPLSGEPAATTAPMPAMEKDSEQVIAVLNSGNYDRLDALATEKYADGDISKPGTLTFTVNLPNDKPTYFNYGWCTTTEEILKQNFQHIQVKLYFNGNELGSDVIHPLTLQRADGLTCFDYAVLLSDWPVGKYRLEAVATFDETINDGVADYAAGDYVFQYNVTVDK